MTLLRITGMAAALLIGVPSLPLAQTMPIAPSNSSQPTSNSRPVGPVDARAGRPDNSVSRTKLTEAQVKKRLLKAGYEYVRDLREEGDGFTARAMKDGRTRTVIVDKDGKIATR
jgi:hypothetical protein